MNNFKGLELETILTRVGFYCDMDSSIKAIQEEKVIYNPLLIEHKIALTNEAMKLLNLGKEIDFSDVYDVREILDKCLKGVVLTSYELRRCLTFHFATKRLMALMHSLELEVLSDYADALMIDDKTYREIDNIIDQDGRIKRNASKRLEKLYLRQESTNNSLKTKAKDFLKEHESSLQENGYFYREDRLTFLLKNSDKNKYNGYNHGDTASKQASYIEPEEFVALNNQRFNDSAEIEEEIRKILKKASVSIAASADLYINNYETLEKLDVIFAKAKYGYARKGILASFRRDDELYLKEIAHPLIDEKKVIRNTYSFPSSYKGIIISGSNTGGKTVTLKTIALAIIMTYLGIPLFADEAIIPFYNGIYVDLEDSSSIESALSSFSSHLKKIDYILKEADHKSLVLIDEIGTGTDPLEAEALSLAIIDRFIERDIPFVLTTHYEEIKKYAFHHDEILLSAVGFDREKLLPTYKYLENTLGESNALKIASRYIDDISVLKRADYYLEKNRDEEEKRLENLRKNEELVESLKADLLIKNEELDSLKKKLVKEKEAFEEYKEKEKREIKEELDEYLRVKKEEADDIVASLKHQKVNSQSSIKIKKLDEINTLKVKEEKLDNKIVVGDRVRIRDNERAGIVLSIEKNRAKVDLGGLSVDVSIHRLEKLPPIIKNKIVAKETRKKFSSVPSEINLIGMHVDEALRMIDKYLDDALTAKRSSVRIIHGIGTMALRNAVRNELKKNNNVKGFKDADFYEGGSAVTVVEFK